MFSLSSDIYILELFRIWYLLMLVRFKEVFLLSNILSVIVVDYISGCQRFGYFNLNTVVINQVTLLYPIVITVL